MGVPSSTLNSPQNNAAPQAQTEAASLLGKRKAAQEEPNPDLVPQSPAPAAAASSAARPMKRSIRGLNSKLDLSKLPAELLDKVASHLPAKDILEMAITNSGIQRATKQQLATSMKEARLTSLTVADEVLQVSTLAEMQGSFQTMNDLPSHLRTQPLRNAMLRIQALPRRDRAQAVTELKAAVNQQASEDRPPELPGLENILGHLELSTAVSHGFYIPVVTKAFGITNRDLIENLECEAARSHAPNTAGAAILAGENVQEVAARFGITMQFGLRRMEDITIYADDPSTAGTAVIAGQNVQEVAEWFGITTPAGLRLLQELAR